MNKFAFMSLKEANFTSIKSHKNADFGNTLNVVHPLDYEVYFSAGDKRSQLVKVEQDPIEFTDKIFGRLDHLIASSYLSDESDSLLGLSMAANDGLLQVSTLNYNDNTLTNICSYDFNTKINSLKEHPISHLNLVLDEDRTMSIFDIKNESISMRVKIEDDLDLTTLSVHPDGKLVALTGTEGQIHFFDLTAGKIVLSIEAPSVNFRIF